jgi:hypothetical protein
MNPLSRLASCSVLFALTSGIAEARDIYVDKNASNASIRTLALHQHR